MVASYIQGYNVGTDVSFSVTDQFGDVFSDTMLGHLTSFSSAAEDNMLKVTPISNGGRPIYQCVWNGHRGSMMFVRIGPQITQLLVGLQQAYHNAGLISQMTIAQKVRNRDGSIDTLTYNGVQFETPDYGTFAGVREVNQRIGFRASEVIASGASALISALMASAG